MISVFFFKQKTAYEMRISDWSSDVCSSDLAASDDLDKLIAIIGNAAAGPAQSEGWTNNGGKPRMIQRGNGLFQRMRNAGPSGFKADFVHRIAAFQAILGLVDSFGIRPDHPLGREQCRERVCTYV